MPDSSVAFGTLILDPKTEIPIAAVVDLQLLLHGVVVVVDQATVCIASRFDTSRPVWL